PDPLLSDDDKRALNRALGRGVFRTPPADVPGEPAPLLPARQVEEPLHFYLGLCAARSALLLWPRDDARGRETLRSPFADEAIRALARDADRAPLTAIPEVDACRAPLDLLARASLEAFADAAWRTSPPLSDQQVRSLAAAVLRSPSASRAPALARAAAAER